MSLYFVGIIRIILWGFRTNLFTRSFRKGSWWLVV